ncbi:hypothetical protein BD408DRAFT_481806 [Parasitella parasitica]|nr:hypothetical protein BD408DRAFT_481806 [Parasitella parasitica]
MFDQLLSRYSPFATVYNSICNAFRTSNSSKSATCDIIMRNCSEFQDCILVKVVKSTSCFEHSVKLGSDKSATSKCATAMKKAASLTPYNPYAGTSNELGLALDILDLFFVDIVCIDYESESEETTDSDNFYEASALPSLTSVDRGDLDGFTNVANTVYDPFYGVANERQLDHADSSLHLDKTSAATETNYYSLFVDSLDFAATARGFSLLAGCYDAYTVTARAFSSLVGYPCLYATQASASVDPLEKIDTFSHLKKSSVTTKFGHFIDKSIFAPAALALAGSLSRSAHQGTDFVAFNEAGPGFVVIDKLGFKESAIDGSISASLMNCDQNNGYFNDDHHNSAALAIANTAVSAAGTPTATNLSNTYSGGVSGSQPIFTSIDEKFFAVKSEEDTLSDKQPIDGNDSIIVDHDEEFFVDFESDSDNSTNSDNYYDVPVAASLVIASSSDSLGGFMNVTSSIHNPFYGLPTTKHPLRHNESSLYLGKTSVAIEVASSGLFVDASVFAATACVFFSLTGYHNVCVAQSPVTTYHERSLEQDGSPLPFKKPFVVTEFGFFVVKSVLTAAACALTSLAGYFNRYVPQDTASVTLNEIDQDFVVVGKLGLADSVLDASLVNSKSNGFHRQFITNPADSKSGTSTFSVKKCCNPCITQVGTINTTLSASSNTCAPNGVKKSNKSTWAAHGSDNVNAGIAPASLNAKKGACSDYARQIGAKFTTIKATTCTFLALNLNKHVPSAFPEIDEEFFGVKPNEHAAAIVDDDAEGFFIVDN